MYLIFDIIVVKLIKVYKILLLLFYKARKKFELNYKEVKWNSYFWSLCIVGIFFDFFDF